MAMSKQTGLTPCPLLCRNYGALLFLPYPTHVKYCPVLSFVIPIFLSFFCIFFPFYCDVQIKNVSFRRHYPCREWEGYTYLNRRNWRFCFCHSKNSVSLIQPNKHGHIIKNYKSAFFLAKCFPCL